MEHEECKSTNTGTLTLMHTSTQAESCRRKCMNVCIYMSLQYIIGNRHPHGYCDITHMHSAHTCAHVYTLVHTCVQTHNVKNPQHIIQVNTNLVIQKELVE